CMIFSALISFIIFKIISCFTDLRVKEEVEQKGLDVSLHGEKALLYEKIASMAKTDFSDDGAKKFFEQNKDKFTFYTQINANIYLS
ncbi:hypothetical protein VWM66_10410, partial [Campylobacter jejuni]